MEKVYAEVGFGNETFLSTEIEKGDIEYRIPGFIRPKNIDTYYFRFWIFKKVFVLSTKNGIELKSKNKNRLKILFGIGGNNQKL